MISALFISEQEKKRLNEAILALQFGKTAGVAIRLLPEIDFSSPSRALYQALWLINEALTKEKRVNLKTQEALRENVNSFFSIIFPEIPSPPPQPDRAMIESIRTQLPDVIQYWGTRVLGIGATEFIIQNGYFRFFEVMISALFISEQEKKRLNEAILDLHFGKTAGAAIRQPKANYFTSPSRALYGALSLIAMRVNQGLPSENQIILSDPNTLATHVERLFQLVFANHPNCGSLLKTL